MKKYAAILIRKRSILFIDQSGTTLELQNHIKIAWSETRSYCSDLLLSSIAAIQRQPLFEFSRSTGNEFFIPVGFSNFLGLFTQFLEGAFHLHCAIFAGGTVVSISPGGWQFSLPVKVSDNQMKFCSQIKILSQMALKWVMHAQIVSSYIRPFPS